MIARIRQETAFPSRRRGFSMVEAAFCVVLVSGLFVASLNTVGASTAGQRALTDRTVGQLLASALMAEILSQEYQDPNQTAVFGLELSENPVLRTTFDDVDDYNGWSASPPKNRDGTAVAGMTGWVQSVTIEVVDATDLTTRKAAETGVKKITVTITHNNVVVARLVGTKTGTPNQSLVIPL